MEYKIEIIPRIGITILRSLRIYLRAYSDTVYLPEKAQSTADQAN